MQIKHYENEEEWLEARRGRVTGTRAKDLLDKRGGGRKIGFYEILAERIALPANDENVMDRGHRLEIDAIARFSAETKKKVTTDLVIWSRDDDDNIAISPDAYVTPKGKKPITEAVEVKCLASARHIEAFVTRKVPSEYDGQVTQYFVVNDDLQTLYFVFYDPRMPKEFFYLTFTREERTEAINEYLEAERAALEELARLEEVFTF